MSKKKGLVLAPTCCRKYVEEEEKLILLVSLSRWIDTSSKCGTGQKTIKQETQQLEEKLWIP